MSSANYLRPQHLRWVEGFFWCTLKIKIIFAFYIQDFKKKENITNFQMGNNNIAFSWKWNNIAKDADNSKFISKKNFIFTLGIMKRRFSALERYLKPFFREKLFVQFFHFTKTRWQGLVNILHKISQKQLCTGIPWQVVANSSGSHLHDDVGGSLLSSITHMHVRAALDALGWNGSLHSYEITSLAK